MRLIAIVGMPGAGKSVMASYLKAKGCPVIRFGQFVIDEVQRRTLPVTPRNEQLVREELRKQQGMDAMVKLALPSIRAHLSERQTVIIDGLYSFSEYKTLKKEFYKDLIVIAVFTDRKLRYQRLASRAERPLTMTEAETRDYLEIENIEKAGPIAIADFTVINNGTFEELGATVDQLFTSIETGEQE